MAMGILNLQERQRIAVFLRPDTFRRFISCLVYVPRDIYNTDLRRKFQVILEQSLNGPVTAFYTQISDSVLARLHFIVQTDQLKFPDVEPKAIEAKLIEAARSWRDHLSQALIEAKGEEKGLAILTATPTPSRRAIASASRARPQSPTSTGSRTCWRPIRSR